MRPPRRYAPGNDNDIPRRNTALHKSACAAIPSDVKYSDTVIPTKPKIVISAAEVIFYSTEFSLVALPTITMKMVDYLFLL